LCIYSVICPSVSCCTHTLYFQLLKFKRDRYFCLTRLCVETILRKKFYRNSENLQGSAVSEILNRNWFKGKAFYACRYSSVSIVTGLPDECPRNRGSISGRDMTLIPSPQGPYQFWGPHSLQCNGYRGLFSLGESGPIVKITFQSPSKAEVIKNKWIYASQNTHGFVA
jgi:hypothetical protein